MSNEIEQQGNWGTFYCIGTGPGDPELLTLKALRLLRTVQVVLIPHQGEGKNSQAYAIIQPFLDEARQTVIPVYFPMTRDKDWLSAAWDTALKEAVELLSKGQDVVFPVLGDPLLYGTFNYLQEGIRQHYPGVKVVIVPGITSVQAATATARLPLAESSERVAILPAIYEESLEEFKQAIAGYDTVVLMKVGGALDRLLPLLEAEGWLDKSVYVQRLGLDGEGVVRGAAIARLKGKALPYFSLLIIKK
jgi:precorrin-2/cobalt-factor-2 C20-methyltransferase